MKKNRFPRLLSLGICLALLLSLLPGLSPPAAAADAWGENAATAFAGGTGTKGDPYSITSGAELAYLAQQVNGGDGFKGVYLVLSDDLDLQGLQWTPIGTSVSPFMGQFDGNGKTISGLAVGESSTPAEFAHSGLFGVVGSGAAVRSLTVTGEVYGVNYSGILAGNNWGFIDYCHTSGTVASGFHNGGLVGDNSSSGGYGHLANSSSSAAVSGDWNTGGLAGLNSGGIGNCFATGVVSNTGTVGESDVPRAGGLAGYNAGSIINCYAAGAVTGAAGSYVGGLAGWNTAGGEIEGYFNDSHAFGIGKDDNSSGVKISGKSSADMQAAAFAGALNGNVPPEGLPWAWAGGLPCLNTSYTALVNHNRMLTTYDTFADAVAAVNGLEGASVDGTIIRLGADTEIDGGEYNVRPGDMPAKPCIIDGCGHTLTAAGSIYLNADTVMCNIRLEMANPPDASLNSHSYDNLPHALTLDADFSINGKISGNGLISGGSRLKVNRDISCASLGNFSEVSLANDVTVTIAENGAVHGVGMLIPGESSTIAFSGSNSTLGNFHYPKNGIKGRGSIILKADTSGGYLPKNGDKLINIGSDKSNFNPAAIVLGEGYADFALLKTTGTGSYAGKYFCVLAEPAGSVTLSAPGGTFNYGGTVAAVLSAAEGKDWVSHEGSLVEFFWDGSVENLAAEVGADGKTAALRLPAGTYENLQASFQDIGRDNKLLSDSISLTVAPKKLTFNTDDVSVVTKEFDGTDTAEITGLTLGETAEGETLAEGADYTVTAVFPNETVGDGKEVAITVTLKDTPLAANYLLPNGDTTSQFQRTGNITPKGVTFGVALDADVTSGSDPYSIDAGDTLTAVIGSVNGAVEDFPVSCTYQWYLSDFGADGVPIAGAAGRSYTVTPEVSAQAGKLIYVAATAAGNYTSVPFPSPSRLVGPQPLGGSISIAAEGTGVGHSLSLNLGALAPSWAAYDIKWTRNGADTGATGTSYTLSMADMGRAIGATLTGKQGYGGTLSADAIDIPAAAPGAPTITDAAPEDGRVTLVWSAPADGGSPITGYSLTVTLDGAHIPGSPFAIESGSTSHTVTSLTNGKEYSFALAAANTAGTGPASNEAAARPSLVPKAPTDLAAARGDRQATLTWAAPEDNGGNPILGYQIEVKTGGDTVDTIGIPDANLVYTVENLTNGTEYTFVVRAKNAAGVSAGSNEAAATPMTTPGKPALTAAGGDRQAALTWSVDNGGSPVTGYSLTVTLDGAHISGSPFEGIDPNATSFTVTGLTNGKEYSFALTAANSEGAGAPSDTVTATPQSPSSGGDVAPPPLSTGGEVPVDYTEARGTAVLSLPEGKVSELIQKSRGAATFDLSEAKSVTGAELSRSALSSLARAGLGVNVVLPFGGVALDEAAAAFAAAQAQGGSLHISLAPVPAQDLSRTQREAIRAEDLVVDISVRSGGQNISAFAGGKITVQMPYTGALPVAVWHLNGAGELEKLSCSYANGVVTFVLDHLSVYVVGEDLHWQNPFADVKESDWFFDAVKRAHAAGLMVGVSGDSFAPRGTATRGMLVTILHRLEGAAAPGASNPFSDVAPGKYYAEAVVWAAEIGLVSGYGGGKFGPEDVVTREQMAVILMNFAERKGHDVSARADLSGFGDAAKTSPWAVGAMAWANANGLIQGDGEGLNPAGNAERGQVAAILQRFLEAF